MPLSQVIKSVDMFLRSQRDGTVPANQPYKLDPEEFIWEEMLESAAAERQGGATQHPPPQHRQTYQRPLNPDTADADVQISGWIAPSSGAGQMVAGAPGQQPQHWQQAGAPGGSDSGMHQPAGFHKFAYQGP